MFCREFSTGKNGQYLRSEKKLGFIMLIFKVGWLSMTFWKLTEHNCFNSTCRSVSETVK